MGSSFIFFFPPCLFSSVSAAAQADACVVLFEFHV